MRPGPMPAAAPACAQLSTRSLKLLRFGCPAGIWTVRPRRVVTMRDGAEKFCGRAGPGIMAGGGGAPPNWGDGTDGRTPGNCPTCAMAVPAQVQSIRMIAERRRMADLAVSLPAHMWEPLCGTARSGLLRLSAFCPFLRSVGPSTPHPGPPLADVMATKLVSSERERVGLN